MRWQLRGSAQAVAIALAAGGAADAAAGGSNALSITAVVLSKNTCSFNTATSALSLTIDPSAGTPTSGAGAVTFKCTGSAATAVWAMSDDGGLHNSAGPRMQNGASFLPYTLSYPASGNAPKNVTQTITLTVSVTASNAQNALIGTYSDTVSLTIVP